MFKPCLAPRSANIKEKIDLGFGGTIKEIINPSLETLWRVFLEVTWGGYRRFSAG